MSDPPGTAFIEVQSLDRLAFSRFDVVIDEITVGTDSHEGDESRFPIPLGEHQVYIQTKSGGTNSLDFNVTPWDDYKLGWWPEAKSTDSLMGLAGGSIRPATLVFKQFT
jgi:hypothetical protein